LEAKIRKQIGHIQAATMEAVSAIQGITTTIAEVSAISGSIASAVATQSSATAEIARNISQTSEAVRAVTAAIEGVSEAASGTGAAAGQVHGAARDLSLQSEVLSGEVNSFVVEVRAA
jgi:methyl-accepting chemotaxis protein